MFIVDPHEKELWEKIKPYLDGCTLRKDAPPEIIAADKELKKIAWEEPIQ